MRHDDVSVSVVLACRNGERLIGRQLDALTRQDYGRPWELIVADNGSSDGTVSVVERYLERIPRLRLLDASDRAGAAHARNVGVAAAAASIIVFCDHDDEVAPGWLSAMATALSRHAFVTATLQTDRLNAGWTRVADERQTIRNTDPPFLTYAPSASLGVRRSLHDAVGGYDEAFEGASEDKDYCYRLQMQGEQLVLVPDAVIHYQLRDNLRGMFNQTRSYGFGNVQLYMKHREAGMRKPSQLRALRTWLLLLPRLPVSLHTKHARAQWCRRAGWKIGRLHGSIRYRVLAL